MEREPLASVVVSTFNRAHLLPRLIAALQGQTVNESIELIIVNDGATDDTAGVLEAEAAATSLAITVLETATNGGPARGRNRGWRAARAPIVLFTDDDCVPEPEWAESMLRALTGADIVQGQTDPDPRRAPGRGPFARMVCIEQWSGRYETCNIGYRRQLLADLGGFDEAFRRPWGEDIDLGFRADELGVVTSFEPGARVVHDIDQQTNWRDYRALLREKWRQVFTARLTRLHPAYRRLLHRRFFAHRSHEPTILGLAACAAAPLTAAWPATLILAAALATPYLGYRIVVDQPQCPARYYPVAIPMLFIADATEVLVMIVGSIRFRSLVL